MDSNQIKVDIQESPFNKILKVMLFILIFLSLGLVGFIFIQMNKKTTLPSVTKTEKTSIKVTPSVIESEDPNDVNIGSVEADLKDIKVEIDSLQ